MNKTNISWLLLHQFGRTVWATPSSLKLTVILLIAFWKVSLSSPRSNPPTTFHWLITTCISLLYHSTQLFSYFKIYKYLPSIPSAFIIRLLQLLPLNIHRLLAPSLKRLSRTPAIKRVCWYILSPTRKETSYSDQTRDLFNILPTKLFTFLSPLP